ncbi:MAG TPA: hypothetical protein ENN43_08665, partial [bacterium]|nr:hypothetical protein [bacterium]
MEENKPYKRKQYIVDRAFQFKYTFIILFVMFLTAFVSGFTVFYVIWNSVIEEFFFVPDAAKKLGEIFIMTTQLLLVPIIVLTVVFIITGILFSHRIAGPVYRIE